MITLGIVTVVLAAFGLVCLVLTAVMAIFINTARSLSMPPAIPAWVLKLCYGAWLVS